MAQLNSPDSAPAGQPAAALRSSPTSGNKTDAELLLQTLPWGVLVLDAHGTVRRLNQQAAHWWGAPEQALRGQRVAAAPTGTLPAELRQALQQVPSGWSASPGEFFLPQQQQWLVMTSVRQGDNWVVYWQDITPQKQRELQYQALALNTPDVLTRWDRNLHLLYTNKALPPAGATSADVPPGDPSAAPAPLGHPTGAYRVALQRVFDSGQPQEHYCTLHTPPGDVHYQTLLVPELRDGRIDTVLAITHDITSLKQAEQALRAEHQRLREAQAQQAATDSLLRRTETVARTGSYELELATQHFQFSDGLFRLFGEAPGAFPPALSFIAARSHPDDAAAVAQVLRQAIADRQPYHYQRRIYWPDGQLRTLEAHGQVECDALGQPLKLLGLLQDVTEREQATQELLRVQDELTQRTTQDYTTLYNSMDEGFCVLEVLFDDAQNPFDYRYLDVNPAFEKQSGLRGAVGKTLRELVPAVEPFWLEVYGGVARSGFPARVESYVEPLGRWFDVNAFAIGLPPHRRVAVLFDDITARKRTEEALRTSDAYLRQAVALAHLGICHWDYQADRIRGNDERFLMLGLSPGQEVLTGAQVVALTHPDDRETWASIRQQLETQGEFQASYRIVRPSDGAVRWLSEVGRVVEWQQEKPAHISSVLLDLTADHEAAEALRQSEARYRSLFTNMEQGFCLLEKVATEPHELSDYRHLAVNPAFARHLGLTATAGETIRQMVPRVEPRILAVCDEVVASGKPQRFEEYVAALDIWLAAEVVPDVQPGRLAVLFSNVSERRRAEQALRESESRQAYLLALSDALRPVVAALEIQAAVTHTALHHFQADRCYYGEIDGDTAIIRQDAARPGLASVAAVYSLSTMPIYKAMLHGNQPVVVADVPRSLALDDSLKQLCLDRGILAYINIPVMRKGKLLGNLCLTQCTPREWTTAEVALLQETAERTWAAVERARAEDALRQSEEQFRLLITATSDTVYRMGADWTQMEQLLGKDFLADTLAPTRTWVEEYIPAEDLPRVQAAIAEAIGQKSLFELEHRVRRADGTVGWTHSRAIPVLDARGELTGWLGAASDVSARKAAEQQLLQFNAELEQQVAERTQALAESQARLQSVFDSVAIGIMLLRAVRAPEGHLVDFEYVLANPVAQAYTDGRPVVGRRYGEVHPGIYHTPVFGQLAAVVETGRRTDFEVHYDYEGHNHWYRLVGAPLGDGLLCTAEDITTRKLLEQGQAQSLALLQESEEVAGLGSWDYDLATQVLTWSDGLYHLLGRPVGSPARAQFFLDSVLEDDRPAAVRLVRALADGTHSFDGPLRLRVGAKVKTVRCKAVSLPAAPGAPVRVLGVCLDVTDVARLEAENLALKLDRHKELLLAILQAQENERQRLAEVLHNSLGQVLYATKLHLDQLDSPALHALPALATLHQQTDRLLTEAMRQTRTLAHELVPTSLAKFGLAVALRDVCRDLSTPQLRVECQVWGEEHALPQPVQVTLFRLAQELAHNIVRHAGATQALLELETLPGWVSLRAEDNGRGFDPQTVAEGLGLRTVRDAVALLGGTVAIDSTPEFGTHIRLRIPLPLFSNP